MVQKIAPGEYDRSSTLNCRSAFPETFGATAIGVHPSVGRPRAKALDRNPNQKPIALFRAEPMSNRTDLPEVVQAFKAQAAHKVL
jgi:hypothetical protein